MALIQRTSFSKFFETQWPLGLGIIRGPKKVPNSLSKKMGFGTPRGTIKKDEVILLNIVFCRKTFKFKAYLSCWSKVRYFFILRGYFFRFLRAGCSCKKRIIIYMNNDREFEGIEKGST